MNEVTEKKECETCDVTRRFGRFRVDLQTVVFKQDELRQLFGQMVVVRAEQMFHCNAIEYTAMCDSFEPTPVGQEPRIYEPVFRNGAWAFIQISHFGAPLLSEVSDVK